MLFLVLILFLLPIALPAQQSGGHTSDQPVATAGKNVAARPALNEQQKRGESLFVENCTLCHMPSNEKKKLGIQALKLEGVYGEDADTDALRQFVQQGLPGKMPSFRYDLDTKDIDDVVAYLKTGAHLKPSGGGN
jgi:mono/diheme cytochrome c family protein